VKDLLRRRGLEDDLLVEDGKLRWTVTRDNRVDGLEADRLQRQAGSAEGDRPRELARLGELVDVVPDPAKVDTGLDHPVVIRAETFERG